MRRFRKYLPITGIPFGLIAAFFFRFFLRYDWLDWLLIIACEVLLGVAYGLTMTVVAYLFTKSVRFSGCASIKLMGMMGIAGLVSGGILGLGSGAWIGERLPRGVWAKIGDPTIKPVEILGANDFMVQVRTEDGNIYYCPRYQGRCLTEEGLVEERVRYHSAVVEDFIDPPVPPAPGKVIDSYEFDEGHAFAFPLQYNYIILEDGTMWVWIGSGSWADGFEYLFVLGVSGLLIGFGAGLLVMWKDWRPAA